MFIKKKVLGTQFEGKKKSFWLICLVSLTLGRRSDMFDG